MSTQRAGRCFFTFSRSSRGRSSKIEVIFKYDELRLSPCHLLLTLKEDSKKHTESSLSFLFSQGKVYPFTIGLFYFPLLCDITFFLLSFAVNLLYLVSDSPYSSKYSTFILRVSLKNENYH